MGIEPGERRGATPGRARAQSGQSPRHATCSRRRGRAASRRPAAAPQTSRRRGREPRQVADDRGAVLRPRVRIGRPARIVRQRRRRRARRMPARPGRRASRSSRPAARSSVGVRSMPAKWPPSAVGEPATTIVDRHQRRSIRAGIASGASCGRCALADFALERYFARWEFAVEHLLCASDVQGWPMAELLELADDETRALWDGLTLGLHGVDRPPAAPARDRRAVRGLDAGRRPRLRRRRGGDLLPGQRAARAGRPRHRDLARLPEPVRGRPRGRRDVTLHELREDDGWALDVDRLRAPVHAGDAAGRRQRPAQPDRHAARPRDVRRAGRDRRARPAPPGRRRGLSLPRARRGRPLPAGADARRAGVSIGVMSKSFAMAGLRIGWLATRDRDAAGALRARSRTTRRSARRRRRRCWR